MNLRNRLTKILLLVSVFILIMASTGIVFSDNNSGKDPDKPYKIKDFTIKDFSGIEHNYTEVTGYITDPHSALIVPFTINDFNTRNKIEIVNHLKIKTKGENIRIIMTLTGGESSRKAREFIKSNNIQAEVWYDKNSKLASNLTKGDKYDINSIFLVGKDRNVHHYYPFNSISDKNKLTKDIIARSAKLNQMKVATSKLGKNKIDLLIMGNPSGDFSVCGCPKQPYGGLARYAYILDEYRRKYEDLPISILTGNILDDYSKPDYHNYYLKGISKMSLTAVTPSLNDFSESPHFLKKYINIVPYTSSNINRDILPVKPYSIQETNGIKVGILSITPREVVNRYSHIPYDFIEKDTERVIRKCLDQIKNKVDIIILNGHFESNREAINTAKPYSEIDFVINSNSDKVSIVPSIIHGYKKPLIELGNKGEFVLKVTIQVSGNKVNAVETENILLDKKITEHGELIRYYYQYQDDFGM